MAKKPNEVLDENKSFSYIKDFGKVFNASRRLMAYAFKISSWNFIGVISTMLFIALIPFVASWLNSKVVDQLIKSIDVDQGLTGDLLTYVVFILITYFMLEFVNTLNGYFDLNLFYIITKEFGNLVTRKFAYLDIEYYEDPKTNDLLQKVKENYSHRPQEFLRMLFWLLSPIITIISACVILIYFKPILIVFLLIIAFPTLINNVVFGKRSWGIWDAKGDVKRDYWHTRDNLVNETSLMELKIFRAREFFIKRVYNLLAKFQDEQMRVEQKRSYVNLLWDTISSLGFVAVYVSIIKTVISKVITIGQFGFYVTTTRQLQNAFNTFFGRLARIYEYGLYVNDIFDVLDLEAKIDDGKVSLPVGKKPPLIEFIDLSFKYPGTEKYVIQNLNLRIRPGDHIAIVGENGAGKTTLVKLLMRFYDITSGDILINGESIRTLKLDSWYEKVGTLFQDFNRYHFDAKTNIGVGDIKKLKEFDAIIKASKNAGSHEFISEYDNEYDQILNKSFSGGIRPSTGQWQRIALARAFFKDAPVLILDEPTSAIDPKAEFEIFEHLFDFTKGKTVLIISHRFSTVRNANRIVVLDDGKVIEDGSHEALMKLKDGKYKNAFEIQRKGYE